MTDIISDNSFSNVKTAASVDINSFGDVTINPMDTRALGLTVGGQDKMGDGVFGSTNNGFDKRDMTVRFAFPFSWTVSLTYMDMFL